MRRVLKVVFVLCAVLVVAGVGLFATANLTIASYGVSDSLDNVLPRKYALLLGTSKFTRSGMVNPYYRYRIVAAVELYKAGKVKKIIASGDNSSKYYNEPATMRDDLAAAGVPKDDIVLDFAGFRTLDSVARCKSKFGVEDPLIITQAYHAKRALYLADRLGLGGAAAYAAKAPDSASYRLRNELRESLARTLAFLDTSVLGTRPKFED